MKKTYVLDTNILLSDPHSIYSFEDNNVIIPLIVLEELDKFKNRQDDVGKNSRFISRELDQLRREGNLLNGIQLKSGGIIKVVPFSKFYDNDLDKFAGLSDNADNQIILFAKSLSEKENNVILVSKDVNVRLKADSLSVKCEDYLNLRAVSSVDEFYTGVTKISLLTDELIQEIYEEGKIDIEKFNKFTDYIEKPEILPNQIVILKNDRNVNPSATSVITKYDASNKILKKVLEVKEVFGLKPKNKEQKFALDLLLDDHIKLVTLMGPSGTGKTLMALVAGLEQLREVGEHGKYDKLIITRPVQSVGREIGFLPGSLEEKMEPWISPIKDNLSFLLNSKNGSPKKKTKNAAGTQMPSFNDPYFDILRDQGKIEVEAISFIRGRSLPNAYIIVEESQNLSIHELKTILTRVGHGTKIVLTGDIEQIDDSHLDIFTNGLSHCVQKFKDIDIAGHVTLIKGERSELATISSKILG